MRSPGSSQGRGARRCSPVCRRASRRSRTATWSAWLAFAPARPPTSATRATTATTVTRMQTDEAPHLHGQPLDDAGRSARRSRRCCRTSPSTSATRRAATTSFGWTAEAAVENARAQVAALIGGDGKEIVWTRGATESNNLAIKGAASFYKKQGNHIITVETEHKSVLDTCKRLAARGLRGHVPARRQKDGIVTPEMVTAAMTDKTIVVSIMLANNEIGVVQDVNAIGAAIKAKNPKTPVPHRRGAGRRQDPVRRRDGEGRPRRAVGAQDVRPQGHRRAVGAPQAARPHRSDDRRRRSRARHALGHAARCR